MLLRPTLLSLGLLVFIGSLVQAEAPQVGDTAADFELVASDGNTYHLSELLEDHEAVVVAWFPKAFTPGCTQECRSFREQGEGIRAFDAAYFTASCDTQEDNAAFGESLEVDYPILCDPSRETALAYGVVDNAEGLPRRWTFYIGPDREILFIDQSVNTSQHGEDVAATLAELGIGPAEED